LLSTPDVPLIARVLCRSEAQGEERPTAVEIGGRRLDVREILDDAVLGSPTAGGGNRRRVLVRLQDGQMLRLERVLPAGDWRVFRAFH
jgi:hypothetical protein